MKVPAIKISLIPAFYEQRKLYVSERNSFYIGFINAFSEKFGKLGKMPKFQTLMRVGRREGRGDGWMGEGVHGR